MFVRWCMLDRPAEFKAYLAACRDAKPGTAPEALFESCFGSIDSVQRSYVLWLRQQVPESGRTEAVRAAQSWSIDGRPLPPLAP
jgi:hypothetical protein